MNEIPIYSTERLDYDRHEGDHSGSDFNDYLQDLILSYSLDDTARGIAKLALDKGTAALSQKQLYTLGKGLENFEMVGCDKCGSIIAVTKGGEYPFFCSTCETSMGRS